MDENITGRLKKKCVKSNNIEYKKILTNYILRQKQNLDQPHTRRHNLYRIHLDMTRVVKDLQGNNHNNPHRL